MSNKYEKFDNEFGLLPAEHENVVISKVKNGAIQLNKSLKKNQLRDHFLDDKCAVEIITNSNNKRNLNLSITNEQISASRNNEFDLTNLQKLSFNQRRWRFYLEQTWFRLLSILIIFTYCILTLIDVIIESRFRFIARPYMLTFQFNILNFITSILVVYFCLEVNTRIYACGSITSFFANWYNSLDFVIIIIDFLVFFSNYILLLTPSARLVCFGRLIRVYVLIKHLKENERTFLFKPTDSIIVNSAAVLSNQETEKNETQININENQIDPQFKIKRSLRPEDYKLDLIYIKENLIISPNPKDSILKFKRNQIKNLDTFLNSKYGIGNYKVYSLCSEQTTINKNKYFNGNYLNFPIENHGIISIEMMKEFVYNMDSFYKSNPDAIVVIHCDDDRKRTCFMACAWLLYKDYFQDTKNALNFFYEQLSDKKNNLNKDDEKINLLQTPSQLRYLEYFEKLIKLKMQKPESKKLNLVELRIFSLIGLGNGNGSDFYCVIQINRFEQFHMNFKQELNCKTDYNSEQDVLVINPINCPLLNGDILIKFFCQSRSVPKPHQDCAFYFWFDTGFLNEEQTKSLRFNRSQIDNANDKKLHSIYRDRFAVELAFN